MKAAMTSFQFLAIAVVLFTQPAAIALCSNGACPVANLHFAALDVPAEPKNCCQSKQESETPCCIEFAQDWQIVPASESVSLPEPILMDAAIFEHPDVADLLVSVNVESNFANGDAPPPTPDRQAVLCTFLI